MAVTIKQIAEMAGVSRGTVDRALNKRGNVNPEVEKRILEIAERLGYKPNLVAKSLASSGQKSVIGVLVCAEGNDFFSEVLAGIEDAADEIKDFGFRVLVKKMRGFDVEDQLKLIDELEDLGITALAVTPINDIKIRDRLHALIEKGIPVVALNVDIEGSENITYVGCDYMVSGQTAGAMMGLVTKGQGRVLIVTGSKKILGHNLRVEGFTEVLKSEYPSLNVIDIIETNDSNDTAYNVLTERLSQEIDFDAIYFVAGGTVGGMQAIIDKGYAHQFKIITNDATSDRIKQMRAGIIDATICQQPYEQGYISIKTLFDYAVFGNKSEGIKKYTKTNIKLKYNFK
ncbi:MAG: LacI family DNA-binding transcriptional regulator [Eubacteriales bacterium]